MHCNRRGSHDDYQYSNHRVDPARSDYPDHGVSLSRPDHGDIDIYNRVDIGSTDHSHNRIDIGSAYHADYGLGLLGSNYFDAHQIGAWCGPTNHSAHLDSGQDTHALEQDQDIHALQVHQDKDQDDKGDQVYQDGLKDGHADSGSAENRWLIGSPDRVLGGKTDAVSVIDRCK